MGMLFRSLNLLACKRCMPTSGRPASDGLTSTPSSGIQDNAVLVEEEDVFVGQVTIQPRVEPATTGLQA